MITARCPHPNVVVWFCQKPTISQPREGKAMVRLASLSSQLLHHFPRTEFAALNKGAPCRRFARVFPVAWAKAVPPWGERGPKKVHSDLFRAFFFKAMERFRAQDSLGRGKGKFKFKNKLLSLDFSIITLCLSLFP
ncbi:hypothetical protein DFAR_2090019 [Desulfarculales bacterium]